MMLMTMIMNEMMMMMMMVMMMMTTGMMMLMITNFQGMIPVPEHWRSEVISTAKTALSEFIFKSIFGYKKKLPRLPSLSKYKLQILLAFF